MNELSNEDSDKIICAKAVLNFIIVRDKVRLARKHMQLLLSKTDTNNSELNIAVQTLKEDLERFATAKAETQTACDKLLRTCKENLDAITQQQEKGARWREAITNLLQMEYCVYDRERIASLNAVDLAKRTSKEIGILRGDAAVLDRATRELDELNDETTTLYLNALSNIRVKLDANLELWRVAKIDLIQARAELIAARKKAGDDNPLQIRKYWDLVQDLLDSV
jgi:hypothetical protein